MDLLDNNEWILDSGATSHISSNEKLFTELTAIESRTVKVADGNKVKILDKGFCSIDLKDEDDVVSKGKLADVLYVPKIKGNFISIRKLTSRGIKVNFRDEEADLIKNEKTLQLRQFQMDYTN